MLVSASGDGTIAVWSTTSHGQLGKPIRIADTWVDSLALSSDGQLLASGADDGQIQLWDMRTRRRLGKSFSRLHGRVRGLMFTHDGRSLISTSDGNVTVWDLEQTAEAIARPTALRIGSDPRIGGSGSVFASGDSDG